MERELGLDLAGQSLLVACSGGADSSALLLCLHYLAPRVGFQICAAHLDHGLRPSSAAEAAACLKLCARLQIKALSERREVAAFAKERGLGLEEAARQCRYDFLREAAASLGCGLVATGHSLNDLAEDQLMRLIRGTGWPGLAGMRALDMERGLVRPLLLSSRKEAEAFLKALGLGWIEDESNKDQNFFRNRVRSRLLPLIIEENPAFLERAAGLWRLGRIDQGWFESALCEALAKRDASAEDDGDAGNEGGAENGVRKSASCGADNDDGEEGVRFLPAGKLRALPPALRLRLYKKTLDDLGPGQARLEGLLALEAAFKAKGKPTRHQFPGDKEALVDPGGISWQKGARAAAPSDPKNNS